jgi:hypothetical protein
LVLPAGAGLFALYFRQSLTAPFNSDGAANVLQAQAVIGGNPLLRGWWTSDVSFCTTELPEYVLVTALRGVSPAVVHLCGALTGTLTLLLAALTARGSTPGRAGWYRAAVTAGIMLAPSVLGGTEVFLENPDHAGTAVPVLALLLLLDRAAGRRCTPWAVCALLALAQLGDELTLAAATVPLAAVCVARLLAGGRLITIGRRSAAGRADSGGRACKAGRPVPGGRADSAGEHRRDVALLAATVAAVVLVQLAKLTLRALGGFDLRPLADVALARPSRVPANAGVLWQSVLLVFGANQPGPPHQAQTIGAHGLLVAMADLHVAGLVLAGAGLAAGLWLVMTRQAERVTAVLVAAIILLTAAGLGSTLLRSLSNAHEVAVLLPLGAVLAGRTLPVLAPRTFPASSRRAQRQRAGGIAALALGAWLAVGVAELGYAAAWPAAGPAQQPLSAWLVAHQQRAGLAGYWQADATTVVSGGRVLVAPVTLHAGGAAADRWESSAAWYQQGRSDATFVIAVTGPGAGNGLSAAAVRARFGPPAAQHQIGPYVIMLYRYNLLTRLAGTAFPGPS